ncbi:MAG: tetratricopeptide repeat protein, partial [Tepidiformaceae bacterium]
MSKTMHLNTALLISFVAGSAWLTTAGVADAQSAKDSALYVQAQQMVANGNAAAGRKLADSAANAAPTGTPAYAEGLYWRATLAANARDSEHEYRQIIVDYPLSGRVPDALLRIGQLESARGESAAALQHFQRLVLEHPQSPLRPEASYWVAQMYFDANDPSHACVANADAMKIVPASNVELKNRIDFQQQRCRGVTLATNAPAAPVSVPVNNVPTVKSVKPPVRPVPNVSATLKEVPVEVPATAPAPAPANAPVKATAEHHDTSARRAKPVVAPSVPREVASAPAVSAPAVSTAVSATPSASETNGSAVVSRPPTKEEVDRALASSAQSKLMKTPTAASKTAKTAKARATPATPTAAKEPNVSNGGYAVQIAAFS